MRLNGPPDCAPQPPAASARLLLPFRARAGVSKVTRSLRIGAHVADNPLAVTIDGSDGDRRRERQQCSDVNRSTRMTLAAITGYRVA